MFAVFIGDLVKWLATGKRATGNERSGPPFSVPGCFGVPFSRAQNASKVSHEISGSVSQVRKPS